MKNPLFMNRSDREKPAVGRGRKSSRLGLGLAIAHKIMELHDSRIAIESTPDIGTTVSFWLPVYS